MKICKVCGKLLPSGRSKYCSDACYYLNTLERKKEYYKINSERIKECQKEYSSKLSPEFKRKKVYDWNKQNPDKSKQHTATKNHNRRARVKNAEGSFTSEEWAGLLKTYDYKCIDCGKSNLPLTVGHAIPLCKDGNNYISNIIPQCLNCNQKQGTKIHKSREDLSWKS